MIAKLDEAIKIKKETDPETFQYEQDVKAIMKCLIPRKGHSLKEPCRAKMIAYEFLSNQKFHEIEGMNSDCNHTFKEDN